MRDNHARKAHSPGDRMIFVLIAMLFVVELTYVLALSSLCRAHRAPRAAIPAWDSDPRTPAVALVIVFGVLTVCTTLEFVCKLRRKPASIADGEELMKALDITAGMAVIAGSVLIAELLRP